MWLFLCLFIAGTSLTITATEKSDADDIQAVKQNGKTITGTVMDKNETIIGANVMIKGTTNGTITDLDGNFTISNVPENAILQISYIGYITQEIKVGNQANFQILLVEDAQALDELVVVGYGIQKKVNLTGSVSNIKDKELASRPVTNVSSALGGLAAGVSVLQKSGQPGSDGATIRIRGTGTLNSGAGALVIIDGIEGMLDSVNPRDIENISILKDAASASIYGAKAANGVILVTTKQGTATKPKISFSGTLSIAQPSKKPKFIKDYIEYMNYANEAEENVGSPHRFSETDFKNWQYAKENPNELNEYNYPMYVAYANTDWWDVILETNIAQNYNVSATGGNEYAKHNISLGYLNNPGIIDRTGIERYQARINLEGKITDFLTVGTHTFFSTTDESITNLTTVWNQLRQTTPGIYPEYDGKLGMASAQGEKSDASNILWNLQSEGGDKRRNRINTTWYARIDLLKGLSFESKINYRHVTLEENKFPTKRQRWNFATDKPTTLDTPDNFTTRYFYEKDYTLTSDNVLRYRATVGNHDVGALVGHNEYYSKKYNFSATGKGLIDGNLHTLGSAAEVIDKSGTETDHSMRSFFGRINYAYKSRYLFEANIRRDGSSRFAKDNRWGTFPSVSGAWRLSEEEFMGEGFRNFFQNFKIRASYGKLGNSTIGTTADPRYYAYMNYYVQKTSVDGLYSFGGEPVTTLSVDQLGNSKLKWEETRVADFAIEGAFFNNRASFEINYYDRYTDGILFNPTIPLALGMRKAPVMSLAEVSNRGVEVTLNWRDKINDFSYSIGTNFSYNRNRVEKYKGRLEEELVDNPNGSKTFVTNFGSVAANSNNGYIIEGHEIGEYATRIRYKGNGTYFHADGTVNINGGPKDGMIRTEKDMEWVKAMLKADYTFNGVGTIGKNTLYYGDLIYADTNGDGNYGSSTDRQFLGASSNPKWNLGINMNAEYKGFDFSMLWQGSFKAQAYRMNVGENTGRVSAGMQIPTHIARDHYFYDPENPTDPRTNLTATYSRLKPSVSGDNSNYVMSDFYIEDVGFMKLKNIQIGYTIPKKWTNKIKADMIRLYLSGENLLTITSYKGIDPETQSYMSYPALKQVAFGFNINF
ncbi:MAG: TonB-dependent receptor [Bacteroides sp.]|nr:TonB-dependent receptor [Bacteroides sp.]